MKKVTPKNHIPECGDMIESVLQYAYDEYVVAMCNYFSLIIWHSYKQELHNKIYDIFFTISIELSWSL